MNERYILDGHSAIPCDDLMEWARWFEIENRRVAEDFVGEVRISTVFLGLDHSFGSPVPILFETMVFGGTHDGAQERYSNWDDAVAGHAAMVALVKGEQP